MSGTLTLYHTGYEEIREPDIHRGRKNADFGQGFYLSADAAFSRKWARIRQGRQTVLNCYELDLSGLRVHRFERDLSWFEYIYANRRGEADIHAEADVIIGPAANDTIYDTLGFTTSGFLSKEEALALLMIGPVYIQAAVRSEKAAKALRWTGAEIITPQTVEAYRAEVREEESAYQKEFVSLLEKM